MHRWVGLALAVFIISCAATGTLLAFNDELHAATAPWMTMVPPHENAPLLDPLALIRAVERAAPEARFDRLELDVRPGHALLYYPSPRGASALPYDEIAVNPYTGVEVHRGTWADLTEGAHQIMPFVYEFHYSLALGSTGTWLLGVVALAWTVDCLIAWYLTLPRSTRRWWYQWRKAWRVKRHGSSRVRVNFDVHRASGLWLWPLLLVFAWSSVAFNLPEVYDSVMSRLGARDVFAELPMHDGPGDVRHDWPGLLVHARMVADRVGKRDGFTVLSEDAVSYRNTHDCYEYRFRSSIDVPGERPQSRLFFDRTSGQLLSYKLARGDLSPDGIDDWLIALHIATVGGLPYRILVAALGVIVVVLTATGIAIWWTKRAARRSPRTMQMRKR